VLHELDDLPIHQSSRPLLHPVSASADQYDRFFHNGYSPNGELVVAVAMGFYPGRRIADAAITVVIDGHQHTHRASRRCDTDRDTIVGGITIDIVRPMVEHRVRVDGRHGIAADLVWRADSVAIEEPRFVREDGGRTTFDYTRLTQFGSWSGHLTIDGQRIDLADVGPVRGCRDRSWGIRPIGNRPDGPATAPQFFWLWTPTRFDDHVLHAAMNHDGDGRPWHESGAVAPLSTDNDTRLDARNIDRITRVDADIEWQPGTRWPAHVVTRLHRWRADPIEIRHRPVAQMQMSGLGYLHPEWGHGMWRAELDECRDTIDLSAVRPDDPAMLHTQMVCVADSDGHRGTSIVETLAIGPHPPSGLNGIIDGATGAASRS